MTEQKPVRRQATRTPTGRSFTVFVVLLLVTGAAAAGGVLLAPPAWQVPLGWSCGVAAGLVTILGTLLTYFVQSTRNARRRIEMMDADATRLANEALPALVSRLRDGASVDTALAELPQVNDEIHQRILRTLGQEIGQGERMRAAAMSACANAASRVQALATTMLADLREMQDRHSEEVLGDLLKLDHTTSQAGRVADSIAVLTGARSGRRWTKPIVMESILRGAVGRINAYQRVRVHSTSNLAVVGHAAEGVMHALAELMDNATKFSPPSEQVHVYVEEVQAGVVVAIEDGGLVMGDLALRRAEQAVSAEKLDLTKVSGTRLGLAVVGCLARKHGLTVFFRPSSRGGTGVVVMIPRHLITEPKQPESTPSRRTPHSVAAPPPHTEPDPTPEPWQPPVQPTAQPNSAPSSDAPPHLPKRRRGQTLAATSASTPTPTQPNPTRSPAEIAAKFGAFRAAASRNAVDKNQSTHND